jgi:hypothetical protein
MDHWMSSLLLTKQEAALSTSNWVWLKSSHTDTCETFSSVMPFRLAVNNIVNIIILPTNTISGLKNVTKPYFNRLIFSIYIYRMFLKTRNRFRGFFYAEKQRKLSAWKWVLWRLVFDSWPTLFLEDSYKKWSVNPFTWMYLLRNRWFQLYKLLFDNNRKLQKSVQIVVSVLPHSALRVSMTVARAQKFQVR